MAICLSHGGRSIYSSSSPSSEVLVGTVSGVYTVQRESTKKWKVSGKALEGLHIHALVSDPLSGLTFAGAHNGSIYASKDFGATWSLRENGLTEKNIYSLNVTRRGDRVKLYAGTEPAHLFESDDLGESWYDLRSLHSVPSFPRWTFPAPPHKAHVKYIEFDPQDSNTIYVCVEVGGLLRSRDGGQSWEELHGFMENVDFPLPAGAVPDDVHRLLIRPSDPKYLYISGGMGICHSRDGGKSWEHLTTPQTRIGYPDPFVFHPGREDLMFMAGAIVNPRTWGQTRTADSRIARSRDGGRNWEMLNEGLPEKIRGNFEAMAIEVWNGSCSLFAGTTDGEIFYSEDEGDQWTKIVEGIPPISKGEHYTRLR